MKRVMLGTILMLLPAVQSEAEYNANLSGIVTAVITYPDGLHILFQMANQPTSHPVCNPSYFAIPATIEAENRKQVYARLLLGYATGQPTNIGYDATGDCAHGYVRVHRVG